MALKDHIFGITAVAIFGAAVAYLNREEISQNIAAWTNSTVAHASPDVSAAARSLTSQMAQPLFGGREIEVAFTLDSRIALEVYVVDAGMLYFSIARGVDLEKFYALATDRTSIRFGVNGTGQTITNTASDPLRLDNYVYRGTDTLFASIPVAMLRVDESRVLEFLVHGTLFDPSIGELDHMVRRMNWYLGSRYVQNGSNIFVNHAAFVVQDDPALSRLAERLTYGASSDEERIQRLLDFVTAIEYDHQIGFLDTEIVRNPYQTIVSDKGDCGNKVILFASLLEQLGITYQLVYTGETSISHIIVAVAGNFSNRNGLSYTYTDGRQFFLAETTIPDFRIGETDVTPVYLQPGQPLLIQEPGKDGDILNAVTGERVGYY